MKQYIFWCWWPLKLNLQGQKITWKEIETWLAVHAVGRTTQVLLYYTSHLLKFLIKSLNWPFEAVDSCGPFPKHRKYTVFLILVIWKSSQYREGVTLKKWLVWEVLLYFGLPVLHFKNEQVDCVFLDGAMLCPIQWRCTAILSSYGLSYLSLISCGIRPADDGWNIPTHGIA